MRLSRGLSVSNVTLRLVALTAVGLVGCGADEDIRNPNAVASAPPPSCSLAGIVAEPEPSLLRSGNVLNDAVVQPDPRPHFSFFVTSQAGLYSLPGGEHAPAPDPAHGFGGDLGGLAGADEICTQLARRASPGDRKIWRAFLSSSGTTGERMDAIGRVGQGPWYDYNGLLMARDLSGLLPDASGRPRGAESPLKAMFTDENGEDVRPPGQDNHDTLTGSDACGRLYDDGVAGAIATCNDWTSKTLHGKEGNLAGVGGQVPVGHSWPRGFGFGGDPALGARWTSDHTISGCEPGYSVFGGAGAPAGDFRVGAGGGYGGIYCFALGGVAPAQ